MREKRNNNNNNISNTDSNNFLLSKYSGHCDVCDQWSNHLYMYLKKKQYYCIDCYKIAIKKG